MLHRGLALVSRLGVFVGRALPVLGLLLFVAGLVAFTPLLWKIIDDELGPPSTPTPSTAASVPDREWMVLSHEAPIIRTVGSTYTLSACITYTTPAGVQERCRQLRLGDGPATERQQDASRCYDLARIGDPLPDCWR